MDEARWLAYCPTVRTQTLATLAMVLALGGCSAGNSEDSAQRRSTPAPPPTSDQAEAAVAAYLERTGVNQVSVRQVGPCVASGASSVCTVDFVDTCDVFAVTRKAGKLVVGPPQDARYCIHLGEATGSVHIVEYVEGG